MRYGLALPTGGECGDPRYLLELIVLAEQAGWDGVFLEAREAAGIDRLSDGSTR